LGVDVNPLIGSVFAPNIQSLDFAPNGDLFGVTSIGNRNVLYRIDVTTGAPTFVAESTLPNFTETTRGIEFLGNRLVGVAWPFANPTSPYFEINPATAAITPIGLTGVENLNSLAQGIDGFLYSVKSVTGSPGVSAAALVMIDPVSGAMVDFQALSAPELAPHNLDIRGLAILPVPEPTTWALVALLMFATSVRSRSV
jgi:hypothetical protein